MRAAARGLRDVEEPLEIAPGEELAVERLERAERVGDGERPAGLGGHGARARGRHRPPGTPVGPTSRRSHSRAPWFLG